jgi:hypothetical protein
MAADPLALGRTTRPMTDRARRLSLRPVADPGLALVAGRTRVGPILGKGLALVAAERIGLAEVIEENLCLPLSVEDSATVRATRLRHYVYFWVDESGADELALAMGNLSFCNHSARPNATIELDRERGVVALRATRPIEAGAEVTIDYGYPLEFVVRE